jgi:hypothetical protein
MANRILRDWTCSETINELSESAEIFFTRLIMKADDFGRFYGSTKLLKAQLYPLKDINLKQIEKHRDECVKNGIIKFYIVGGKEYIEIKDFNQRLRLMKSKFPEPVLNDGQLSDSCQTSDGSKRSETETEVETETETEVEIPKTNIPTINEFLDFFKSINEFDYNAYLFSVNAKYEQWVSNAWKDGNGNEIKNWKSKLKNTLPHLKPMYQNNLQQTQQQTPVKPKFNFGTDDE